jgi:protein-tyrosine phosphatase
MKILMVCLGNICRSPLAEGILQHKSDELNLHWQIDSAGTANYHVGEPPHHLSQKVAKMNGIDISQQKCRQFKKEDMLLFDKIYAMDNDNYNDIKKMSGNLWDSNRVELILNELHPGKDEDVPDPWYGTEVNFHQVFDLLTEACNAIVRHNS